MIFFKTLFTFPLGLTTSSNYGRLCRKFVRIQCIRMKVIQSYGAKNLLHYQIEKDHSYFWPHTHNNIADNCFFPISHFSLSPSLYADSQIVMNRTIPERSFPCFVRNKWTLLQLNKFLADPQTVDHSKTTTSSLVYITFCSVHLKWFHVLFPKWNIYQDE